MKLRLSVLAVATLALSACSSVGNPLAPATTAPQAKVNPPPATVAANAAVPTTQATANPAGTAIAPRGTGTVIAPGPAATAAPAGPPAAPSATAKPNLAATPNPSCIYKAGFVADVTIPDGTAVPPSNQFTKIWRVRNDGTCAWGPGSGVKGLISTDTDRIATVSAVDFPISIEPGQTIEISIQMQAPDKAGRYKSEWLFASTNGGSFGVGRAGDQSLSANFVVDANAKPATGGEPPAPPAAGTDTCTIRMAYVADVTIPDDTRVLVDSKFVKTWRVRNSGTCAWGPGSKVSALAFAGGDKLGVSAGEVALPAVPAGATAEISVDFTAPATAGKYRSDWKLKTSSGQLVGLGADGATPIYVQINVAK